MNAAEAIHERIHGPAYCDPPCGLCMEVVDLLEGYAHELAEKQRELLRQGFRQPGYASVVNSLGQHEPLGTTHVIDHIDPEITEIRPARVALAELSRPEVLNSAEGEAVRPA